MVARPYLIIIIFKKLKVTVWTKETHKQWTVFQIADRDKNWKCFTIKLLIINDIVLL